MVEAPVAALAVLALWGGTTLVLSEVRAFSRTPLTDRLRPYAVGGLARPRRAQALSVESFREVVGPLATFAGERLARAVGVTEDLGRRLERVHAEVDPAAFRLRQMAWALPALGTGLVVAIGLRLPAPLALLLVMGAPVLVFLVTEHRTVAASERWQRRLAHELPVVAEQLAMLLSAGYSLGAALNRVATRGTGACARDLTRVCARVRQGLSEPAALEEWAALARVPAVDRVTAVLRLQREATDLGRLLSAEARSIRRELHRGVVETLERRGQQVWVPVTVATLVPGVVFLSIPFIEALRVFSGQ